MSQLNEGSKVRRFGRTFFLSPQPSGVGGQGSLRNNPETVFQPQDICRKRIAARIPAGFGDGGSEGCIGSSTLSAVSQYERRNRNSQGARDIEWRGPVCLHLVRQLRYGFKPGIFLSRKRTASRTRLGDRVSFQRWGITRAQSQASPGHDISSPTA